MISLDQVLILEKKVESAVNKITQLQAENDALRNKCAELTNALSAKSEQLTSFETDQSQIEDGIKKALDRLNSIENSVLKTVSAMNTNSQAASATVTAPVQSVQAVAPETPAVPVAPVTETPTVTPTPNTSVQFADPSFDTMTEMEEPQFDSDSELFDSNPDIEPPEDDNQDGLSFDIF